MAEDTRSGDADAGGSATALRTFLIADVRGYTRYTREHGDEAASSLAGRFARVVRDTVPLFSGELMELRGDEALCVFGSARQALRAAVELQRRLRTRDDCGDAFPLGVGVGVDAADLCKSLGARLALGHKGIRAFKDLRPDGCSACHSHIRR